MDSYVANEEQYDSDDMKASTCSLYSLEPNDDLFKEIASFHDLPESDVGTALSALSDYSYVCTDQTLPSIDLSGKDAEEESELLTALSHVEAKTALSEVSIYSEYSLPPSEANVEIENDVIAEASPLSTAVCGSVSWYSVPNSETEIELKPTLYMGGVRIVDSLECMHLLPQAELRPVESFCSPNVKLICQGHISDSEKESEKDLYEYSYYSDKPWETSVSMENVDMSTL